MSNDAKLQVEPNQQIVRCLLDFGVLRQGGREALIMGRELAEVVRRNAGSYPTDAVAEHMRRDLRYGARLNEADDLVIAAGEVVDIVDAHDGGVGDTPNNG